MVQKKNLAWFLTAVLLWGCSLLPVRPELLIPSPVNGDAESISTPLPPGTEFPVDQADPTADEPAGAADITPIPKPAPLRLFRFTAEKGTPVLMPAFMHTELGCEWMGIGGQVFDAFGQPMIDMVVLLRGTFMGEVIDRFTLTGTSTAFGPGGYEFILANKPIATEKALFVGLYDSYGNKLSSDVYFNTSDLCESNLVLLNFKEFYFEDGTSILLPLIQR